MFIDGYQELAFWRAHVAPAADCPHYITTGEADAGILLCAGCAERPVVPTVKQNRGKPNKRTAKAYDARKKRAA